MGTHPAHYMGKKVSLSFLLLVILSSCSGVNKEPKTYPISIQTQQSTISIKAEIAKTEKDHAQGLMYRTSLPEDQGMLFVFPNEQKETFWMKNTLIALDIFFISSDKKIVHIEKNVPPCKSEPCPLYSSGTKVLYVLETNGGFADKYNIVEGDALVLPSNL